MQGFVRVDDGWYCIGLVVACVAAVLIVVSIQLALYILLLHVGVVSIGVGCSVVDII